jgi:hypothetical protein
MISAAKFLRASSVGIAWLSWTLPAMPPLE